MGSKLDALRQAHLVSPDNGPLLQVYAEACLEEWVLDEARAAFEKLLQLDPASVSAKLGVARTLYASGQSSEAAVRLEALLGCHPQCASAMALLARIELGEGNSAAALKNYEAAIGIDPLVRDAALEKELYGPRGREADGGSPQTVKVGAGSESTPPNSLFETETREPNQSSAFAELERPQLNFASVGAMDSIKEEIRMKIIHPLKNPDLFRAYGKKIGGGVLLYGPPGCGKTLLARATAGEIKASFLSIGIHQILNLYLGESERNLHELFETARRNVPAVLFFDEVDALAADRNDLRRSAGRTLINQFLAELDGNVANNEGILVLGATNAPWHLDPAFRRPGRFDRILFVPPPDEASRSEIISVMARDKPIADLDVPKIAGNTKNFSGADLKAMFDVTIERLMARAMKEGHVVPLTTRELVETAKKIKPSTRAWFQTARNYALYSNQGGFYDDVLEHLGLDQ